MKGKQTFFEFARWLAVALALVYLFSMFGGNTASSAKAEDVTAAVTDVLDMSNMVQAENQMIKRLYGIDPHLLKAAFSTIPPPIWVRRNC